jgi:TRAP-type C4-dicarboxylate transport system substrate-binding protein
MRILLAAISFAGLLASSGSALSAIDKPITLRLADTQSVTHPVSVDGAQYFIKRVSELSAGKIKITHYPAEQLGKSKDTLDILAGGGVTDISFIGPSWYPGKLPLSTVGDLPGMYIDSASASKAVWKILSTTVYDRELKKRGIRPLIAFLTPTYQVLATKPIDDLSNMTGQKIRSPGGTFENTAMALRATAVSMPANEAYEAMRNGVLGAAFSDYIVADGQKLNELVKYGSFGAPLGSFTNTYCINQRAWDALPVEAQKILTQAGEETMNHLNAALNEREIALARQWEQKGSMKIKHLNADEQKRLVELLRPVQEKWSADMERRGLPGKKTLAEFRTLLQSSQDVKQ